MMNRRTRYSLLFVLVSSLACQLFFPARTGTVISACADVVSSMQRVQPGDIPDHLFETGEKRGDEFDANQYFSALTHISMREGYILDYLYQADDLGGFPLLYAHPAGQARYASFADVPPDTDLPEFQQYLDVDDSEQSYFEFVVLDLLASQFYLYWHANYNDTEIVCNRSDVDEIVDAASSESFGIAMNVAQQAQARAMRNIEPAVRLNGDVAVVEVITFTKWGGFYRTTYTISRETPHRIIDVQSENLVPYDCGIMF